MSDNVEGPAETGAVEPTRAAKPLRAVPPDLADDVEHKLDPRSIVASRMAGGIFMAVFFTLQLIALLVLTFAGAGIWTLLVLAIFGALALFMGSWVWFWPKLRYSYAAYRVNPRGIHIRDGVLFRSVVSVPRSRVQHTDVSQGPLARAYGLATLIVHTAGTEHASVSLAGLPKDRAYAIRDHLIEGGEGDAV